MKRITATHAARNFSDVLNQVAHHGESFIILRNGEEVGQLVPVRPTATLGDFLELLSRPVDPQFAEDLRDIQESQPTLPEDPWPS